MKKKKEYEWNWNVLNRNLFNNTNHITHLLNNRLIKDIKKAVVTGIFPFATAYKEFKS